MADRWRRSKPGRMPSSFSFLTEEERARGDVILPCVSRALTPVLVLDC